MNNRRSWRCKRGNYGRDWNFRGRGRGGYSMNCQYGPNWNEMYDQYPYNYGNNYGESYMYQPNFARVPLTRRLSENDIGVTEYVTDHAGFNGIIKSRYSDFQVAEINMNGETAKLTNMEPPRQVKEEAIEEDEDLVLNKYNLEILPMETWDNINKLAIANKGCTEKVEIDVTGMSKEQRTKIHDAVKKAFGKGIVGSTVTIDDKKFVCFEKFRKGVRIDKRVKWLWPGEYVYFILHKENCDTMEAAARIAERLRMNLKPSMLGYAGTKDRRAKTSQWFSIRKVDPVKIAEACQDLKDIYVGNYSFANVNLKLGMLKGNRFRIVLRNVKASDESINEACDLLKEKGFINYYGLQRFGTRIDTPTYEIGLKLFQGKYLEAINLILEPRAGPFHRLLLAYRKHGAADALRFAPPSARPPRATEWRLLRALATSPKDLIGAIGKIPRNSRLLYIHSYQSLVWNLAASERLRRLGPDPVVGDLVPLTPADINEEIITDDGDESDDNEDTPDVPTEEDGDKQDSDTNSKNTSKKTIKQNITEESNGIAVKVLTQEDIDSGKYTIFDVVLPLVGCSVKYPPNMIEFYREFLAKDGLTLDMKNKIKSLSVAGAYRRVRVAPAAVLWRSVRYSDPRADLQLSDHDVLQGRTRTGEREDGKFKALLLSFTLPSSCYATMALRELLKVDTSCDKQASQNDYHKGDNSNESQDTPQAEKQDEDENVSIENQDNSGGEKRKLADDSEDDPKKVKSI